MKTSAKPPDCLALNAIDRSFLIPETDNVHGDYFPITSMVAVQLQRPITSNMACSALKLLETHFPQLRLGYQLDLDKLRWQRVPDDQMSSHINLMVSVYPDSTADLETVLSEIVNANITPFSLPIAIILHQRTLVLRLNHSFSDGMLAAIILKYLMTAIDYPEQINGLPRLNNFHGLPLIQIVRQQPNFLWKLLQGWTKTIRDFSPSDTPDLHPRKRNPNRTAPKTGARVSVKLHRLSPETMSQIKTLRTQFSTPAISISTNTLLQVLIARRLHELGYIETQVNYTIPVDLHRYLPNPAAYYSGNLSSQIRVTVKDTPLADIGAQCQVVQSEVNAQLEAGIPLYSPTLDWLMRIVGRKRYNKMNRDWYTNSIHTDPRLFILSNMGDVTRVFRSFEELIDFDAGVFGIGPLMGGPPLVLILGIIKGQGNMGITYDPQIFTEDQIDEILSLFDSDWLATHCNPESELYALDH